MSQHLGRDLREINLTYWKQGFDALFERYETLDTLVRRLVQRHAIGDDVEGVIQELRQVVGIPEPQVPESIRPGHTAATTHVGFVDGCPDCQHKGHEGRVCALDGCPDNGKFYDQHSLTSLQIVGPHGADRRLAKAT